jgi:hypothetical protein
MRAIAVRSMGLGAAPMRIERTERGFEVINFVDRYGADCSLQQSSAMIDFETPGASAIWFGTSADRMHLDFALLRQLLPHLQAWTETGSFTLDDDVSEGAAI